MYQSLANPSHPAHAAARGKDSIWRGVLRPALTVFVVLSAIVGLLYPLAVTGVARLLFPDQAAGSLIVRDGKVVGSRLIGQSFTGERYFWGRPSATGPQAYNAASSGAANLGPNSPVLAEQVATRVAALRAAHPDQRGPVPADLATSSASGLDPHISPEAALYQAGRIARARQLPESEVRALIVHATEGPQLGLFGESRVNVLALNLALDDLKR
ncbi:K+-transporting ATPase ATPase C chain [Microvirgula sp. AG722]|uniref:potassium-transporting ATPase subunit KdpC n=1 Tax=Microvirgula sp. AG722 TaxID=2183901 RepID=UPI000DC4DE87|nr:potassium-transporting ATPase subunit KdpC [Microvirgula sp. AG722]RAS18993.1 K+-transporting ATPase ATPase C chain [Microvirgula sp. AG722]